MNPNEASANKTYNITTNGVVTLPVPTNPKAKLVLLALVVNTKGGSGSTIGIFDSTEALGADSQLKKGNLDTATAIGTVTYNFPCFNGIYLVVGGGTAPDVTVVYAETP